MRAPRLAAGSRSSSQALEPSDLFLTVPNSVNGFGSIPTSEKATEMPYLRTLDIYTV